MVRFRDLGFRNFSEYKDYFFRALLPSNKTYDYFVDWQKVKSNLRNYIEELSLLNSLTKIDKYEKEAYLKHLILNYPRILETIPLLIAERVQNGIITVFDDELMGILSFNFSQTGGLSEKYVDNIVKFCRKVGIIDLFNEVKDLYDYLLGVEVGLDSNARKNRSGKLFEKICIEKLKYILDHRFILKEQDALTPQRKHDAIIYTKENKPLLVVECNFYNVEGSKPEAIAREYIGLYKDLKKKGIEFLWITDGPAWNKMKNILENSMKELDWILNLKMLNLVSKILNAVLGA